MFWDKASIALGLVVEGLDMLGYGENRYFFKVGCSS